MSKLSRTVGTGLLVQAVTSGGSSVSQNKLWQPNFKFKTRRLHRRKHESRIRTSTALIAREINMRELKQNSQHFS